MVICIFIVCVMFSEMTTGMMRDEWFAFLVLYLVAALVYFAYELITTKKWKNLLTALPGLGIVALLNVGILLGMHAVEKHIVAQRPAMQEIILQHRRHGLYFRQQLSELSGLYQPDEP